MMNLRDRTADLRFLLRDRAGQFTQSFDTVLASTGIEAVKIPPRSPRANACAEQFVLTARTEVTGQILIFGERHLRSILARYEAHCNGRRPCRSRQLRRPGPTTPSSAPLGNASSAARPRGLHQRIRAGCVKSLVKDGGRVLAPAGQYRWDL